MIFLLISIPYLLIASIFYGYLENEHLCDEELFFSSLWPLTITVIFIYKLLKYIVFPILKTPMKFGDYIYKRINK